LYIEISGNNQNLYSLFLCFVDRVSLYILVNKVNLVRSFS